MSNEGSANPEWATWLADPRVQLGAAAVLLVWLFLWCRIFAKAGYHAATGMLMAVPGLNLLMLVVLAMHRWPVRRELRDLRRLRGAIQDVEHARFRKAS